MKNLIKHILQNAKPILFVIVIGLIISGYNILNISQSVFPKTSFPQIQIKIDTGFSPLKNMELQVTKPLEDSFQAISGVKNITSKTYQGINEVDLSFNWKVNIDKAYQEVLANLTQIKSSLPKNAKIKVVKMTTSAFAVQGYSLYSDTLSLNELKNYVKDTIKPLLLKVDGVNKVDIIGGVDKQFDVVLKPNKLIQYGLNPIDVSNTIKAANNIQFVGSLNQDKKMYLGVSDFELKNISDIQNIIIKTINKRTVYLKDIASIALSTSPLDVATYTNGHKAILFNIIKHEDTDVLTLSKDIDKALNSLQTTLPKDAHISKWYDLSEFVVKSIDGIKYNLFMGMFIVSFVVILFLRNFKMSFSLLVFIPITFIFSLMIMKYLGMSLNIMSLGGLAAALGILVDNASVVVENIARKLQKTQNIDEAIEDGTSQVASPLFFATLTTIAVFIPLLLLDGISGFFFKSTSLTIVISLSLSLLLAFVFIPVLMKYLFANYKIVKKESKLSFLQKGYKLILSNVLHFPSLIIVLALVLGGYSIYLYKSLPTSFLPTWDEGTFIMDLDTDPGTSFDTMAKIIKNVEGVIKDTPIIQTYSTQIGDAAVRPNEAHFYMHPKIQSGKNAKSTFDIMDKLEEDLITKYPDLNIDLHQILPDRFKDFSGKQKSILVKLTGVDKQELLDSYKIIKKDLSSLENVKKIKAKIADDTPVLDIKFKKEMLRKIGLTQSEVSNQIKLAMQGDIPTQIAQDIKSLDLKLTYPKRYKLDSKTLEYLPIFLQNGNYIYLHTIADIKTAMKPKKAYHENGLQVVNMEIKTKNSDFKTFIPKLQEKLKSIKLPKNVSVELSGDWKNQQKSFKQLLYIILVSALLVFILLLWQFKKYSVAFILFSGTILSLSFVIFGLSITKTTFNVSAFIGLIISLGIVVNNGILVVNFIENLKEKSNNIKDIVIEASVLRVRPIMITSITTIGGFAPMVLMLGNGGEMLHALAVAVIFGLIGSVVVSLFVIPSLYLLVIEE